MLPSIWTLSQILLVLSFMMVDGRLRKYENTLCVLTGSPTRGPMDYKVFANTGTQRCYLYTGRHNAQPGKMVYNTVGSASDKQFTWRLSTASIDIYKTDLDTGTAPNDISYTYIHQLDDTQSSSNPMGTAITGMVLGQKLGGLGTSQQNLFPQSSTYQVEYQALETEIYNCLKNNLANVARIQWQFNYQTSTNKRPYSISYDVKFIGSSSTNYCADRTVYFNN